MHHIDIQYFTLKQWKKEKHVILHHVLGMLNPAHNLIKALVWILHTRHTNRLMGYFKERENI